MALKTNGGLETMSLVLTVEQARELRAIRDARRTDHNRVSISDVAREVVAKGLKDFPCAPSSDFFASDISDSTEAI